MRVLHRLSWRPTEVVCAELLALGFDPSAPHGLLTLVVDEADPRWPAVCALAAGPVAPVAPVDVVTTEASEAERAAAARLAMHPTGHAGYPQPEDDYAAWTYDAAEGCPACGGGAVQRAPFRLRGDPRLRPGRVTQLNWVFDEYFTTPETWDAVFRPFGVGHRPVVAHRTDAVLPGVVQLELQTLAPGPLALGDHPSAYCAAYGRRRYAPYTRGFLPAVAGDMTGRHAVRTRETFGSGGSTYRAVLVSQALYRAVRAHRVRGCTFLPTQQPAWSHAPVA